MNESAPRITCPRCHAGINLPGAQSDTLVDCPKCSATFLFPAPAIVLELAPGEENLDAPLLLSLHPADEDYRPRSRAATAVERDPPRENHRSTAWRKSSSSR